MDPHAAVERSRPFMSNSSALNSIWAGSARFRTEPDVPIESRKTPIAGHLDRERSRNASSARSRTGRDGPRRSGRKVCAHRTAPSRSRRRLASMRARRDAAYAFESRPVSGAAVGLGKAVGPGELDGLDEMMQPRRSVSSWDSAVQ
jgi:hypothetical protein